MLARPWLQLRLSTWSGSVRVDVTGGTGGVQTMGHWLPGGRGALSAIQEMAGTLKEAATKGGNLRPEALADLAELRGTIEQGAIARSFARVQEAGRGRMFLLLALDPELHTFPWETVWNPPGDPTGGIQVIRAVRDAPLDTVPDVRAGLRMLIVAPELTDLGGKLIASIEALLPSGAGAAVTIEALLGPEGGAHWGGLRQRLRSPSPPHLLHFVGHGLLVGESYALRFSGTETIPVAEVADALPPSVQLVYLQACDSASAVEGGPAKDPSALISGAEAVGRAADAVIGHLWPVNDLVSVTVAQAFYRALLGTVTATKDAEDPADPAGTTLDWRDCVTDAMCTVSETLYAESRLPSAQAPAVLYVRGRGPEANAAGRLRRIHVLYAPADWPIVRPMIHALSGAGQEVHYALPSDGALTPASLARQLERIEELHVLWSAALAKVWNEAELRAVVEGAAIPDTLFWTLDQTPVVAAPDSSRVLPARGAWDPVFLGGAGVALAASLVAPRLDAPGWPLLLLAGALFGLALLSRRTGLLGSRLHLWIGHFGDFLTTATDRQVIAAYASALDRAFGPIDEDRGGLPAWRRRLPTPRELRRAAVIAGAIYLPFAVAFSAQAAASGLVAVTILPLVLVFVLLPMMEVAGLLLMTSLTRTRVAIARYLDTTSPDIPPLVARNLAIVLGIAALLAILHPAAVWVLPTLADSWTTWPVALLDHVPITLSGGLRAAPLWRSGFAPLGILTWYASVFAAAAPLLGYTAQLALARLARAPSRPLTRLGRSIVGGSRGARAVLVGMLAAPALLVVLVGRESPPSPTPPAWGPVTARGTVYDAPATDEFTVLASLLPSSREVHDKEARTVRAEDTHRLTLHEVTQDWWATVVQRHPDLAASWGLAARPATYRGGSLPVESVSWCDAARFLNLWSIDEGLPVAYEGRAHDPSLGECAQGVAERVPGSTGYRLPTEDEWELAARLGVADRPEDALGDHAWYGENSSGHPHPVGTRAPDARGAFDLLGNVYEWVETPDADGGRRMRGGSCWNRRTLATPWFVNQNPPTAAFFFLGFRAAQTVAGPPPPPQE